MTPAKKVGADLMTQAGYPGHLSKPATFDFPVAMQYTFSPSGWRARLCIVRGLLELRLNFSSFSGQKDIDGASYILSLVR